MKQMLFPALNKKFNETRSDLDVQGKKYASLNRVYVKLNSCSFSHDFMSVYVVTLKWSLLVSKSPTILNEQARRKRGCVTLALRSIIAAQSSLLSTSPAHQLSDAMIG
jgi:hypothetical protein